MADFQTIFTLLKGGLTLEAQEKIVELREEMMGLKEENLGLRAEIQSLKQQLAERAQATFPPCPKCGKAVFKIQSSRPDSGIMGTAGFLVRTYKCEVCGFSEEHRRKPGAGR